jgi:hypothetical protein
MATRLEFTALNINMDKIKPSFFAIEEKIRRVLAEGKERDIIYFPDEGYTKELSARNAIIHLVTKLVSLQLKNETYEIPGDLTEDISLILSDMFSPNGITLPFDDEWMINIRTTRLMGNLKGYRSSIEISAISENSKTVIATFPVDQADLLLRSKRLGMMSGKKAKKTAKEF